MSNHSLAAQLAEYQTEATVAPEDIALADAAQQWMEQRGWQFHYIHGWSDGKAGVFPDPECGLVFRSRDGRFWPASGEAHTVRSFKQALNIMVEVLGLPSRFTTHGRDALRDYAEAVERAAVRLKEEQDHWPNNADTYEARLITSSRAAGLRQAAEVARERDPIAVFA